MLRKLLALALFAPATALADVAPDQVPLANGCTQYTLCAAETDTTAAEGVTTTAVNAAGSLVE